MIETGLNVRPGWLRVLVVGPECTGSTWTTQLLRAHPEIEWVEHKSFPHNLGTSTFWPSLDDHDPARESVVVLCVRDESIMLLSQARSGYADGRAPKFREPKPNWVRDLIWQQINGRKLVWCDYEALVSWGIRYFEHLLGQLGVNPKLFPRSEFKPLDGNRKYVQA